MYGDQFGEFVCGWVKASCLIFFSLLRTMMAYMTISLTVTLKEAREVEGDVFRLSNF